MKKLYNVHVGMRYTTNVLVEAESLAEATEIVDNHLASIEIEDCEFAQSDYDAWEENPEDYTIYYVMNEQGGFERR